MTGTLQSGSVGAICGSAAVASRHLSNGAVADLSTRHLLAPRPVNKRRIAALGYQSSLQASRAKVFSLKNRASTMDSLTGLRSRTSGASSSQRLGPLGDMCASLATLNKQGITVD